MGAVSLRFGLLATALLAMIVGATLIDARPVRTNQMETVYAMPSAASGMRAMGMDMLGMGSCTQTGAGGMSGCTMLGPCSHCSQMTRIADLDIVAPALRRDFGAASPPLPVLGRSLAPNPAPPKPQPILS